MDHASSTHQPPAIRIDRRLWNQLADLVQDLGRVHPAYVGLPAGEDLAVLGTAIRYCIDDGGNHQLRVEAEKIIIKHGFELRSTTLVGRCIETANSLLGFPK